MKVLWGILLAGYITLIGFYMPYVKQEAFRDGQWDILETSRYWGERQLGLVGHYGCLKNVPWDKFTIEEKMMLCAYGSLGNKMTEHDIVDVAYIYGPQKGDLAWDRGKR